MKYQCLRPALTYAAAIILSLAHQPANAVNDDNVDQVDHALSNRATTALRKAVDFFTNEVAVHGGYVWRYTADLSRREGEGKVGRTTVWLQPPGTPSVGTALLDVYERTADPYYLQRAHQTALCLVNGQLRSGGWTAHIEFAPADRARYAYRVDIKPGRRPLVEPATTPHSTMTKLRRACASSCATTRRPPSNTTRSMKPHGTH